MPRAEGEDSDGDCIAEREATLLKPTEELNGMYAEASTQSQYVEALCLGLEAVQPNHSKHNQLWSVLAAG